MVAVACGVALLAGASHAYSEGGYCSTSLPGTLLVHEVKCAKAKRVIARYGAKAQSHGPHIRVLGFKCDARGYTPIRCRRGRQHIKYSGGF